ncbi:MAG: hypothetical protein H6736_16725 [Alphaproteobacteria bacterium]|nr:hypothetical protein [Alphaproteobacteria bacterium]
MVPLVFLSVAAVQAVEPPNPVTRLELAAYDTATTLPLRRMLAPPLHPGVEIGLARQLTRRENGGIGTSVRLGGFVHAPLVRAMTLDVGLDGALRHPVGLVGVVGWQLGVQAGMPTEPEHVADGAGGFEQRAGRVRAQMRTGLRVAAGWRLGRSARAPELLAFHRVWVETPFAPGFIPVVPHGDTGLLLSLPLGSPS